MSPPCPMNSAGWRPIGLHPLAEWHSNKIRTSHQTDKDLVGFFVYFRCAKSQTFWGYIHTLCFLLSLLVRLILTCGSLIYSCYQMWCYFPALERPSMDSLTSCGMKEGLVWLELIIWGRGPSSPFILYLRRPGEDQRLCEAPSAACIAPIPASAKAEASVCKW